ncbi:MAG: TIGR04282 family arsenosugar biosynthesis glycosyltransferase [Gammaproteobacteria bacterium]|nr:TIGR04282 family arsenosugar biosynthesis glycosyltransferase [Gammaproteobacteria bacterium]
MKYPHAKLLIFSKAPEPGQVKTRLIPALGATGAAQLYSELLDACLDMGVSAQLCPVALCCSPSTAHAHFQQLQERYRVELRQQANGDLGRRMSQALQAALQHSRAVLLVGADCPSLCANDLDTALEQLNSGVDVVLGPARDGGYYLVGMRTHHPGLFENIPWGTHTVLEHTRKRMQEQGLRSFYLPLRSDLDTPADYHTWQDAGSDRCPIRADEHDPYKSGD